jgi:hypothetical protein
MENTLRSGGGTDPMKLGIMQPYFFPYAQQFRHIRHCDHWVVFDTPNYQRKTWISRNRIIDPNNEWSYISVPVEKGATQLPISQALVKGNEWIKSLFDRLRVYSHSAPFYSETLNFIEISVCNIDEPRTISGLNTHIIKSICKHLEIETEIKRLSDISLGLPTQVEPGDWALSISKALGAKTYSNAAGGRHLFDPYSYQKHGIDLEFYEPIPLEYPTARFRFVPGLSVVDTLMWLGREGLRDWSKKP